MDFVSTTSKQGYYQLLRSLLKFKWKVSGRMNPANLQRRRTDLLGLCKELGAPENRLCILAEGNASTVLDEDTFLIKASGTQFCNLQEQHLVQVRFEEILSTLDEEVTDEQVEGLLLASRVNPDSLKPSVETHFHAWLLKIQGVQFVAHTHPVEVNKVLCCSLANQFTERRCCPDEVVCCGPKFLLIDYVDPGIELARAIREGWETFVTDNGFSPRTILLKNHGLIAIGSSAAAVLATTQMAVKAAEIFWGACLTGEPVFMPPSEVDRIASRQDEAYRQKQLNF
ncbi:class II aldolase/adducin family protein [Acidobacteria bacterium AH-259-O06]|nr:class II aldolase/adducin family protein [Acidobacteria bacterium AH-259-O06]